MQSAQTMVNSDLLVAAGSKVKDTEPSSPRCVNLNSFLDLGVFNFMC